MRIAVLIIALGLTLFVGLQSCTIMMGGGVLGDQQMADGGGAGIILAILFVIGGAFVLSMPKVSMVFFAIASMIGFSVGASTIYQDMLIWGAVSAALAVMSFIASRSPRVETVPVAAAQVGKSPAGAAMAMSSPQPPYLHTPPQTAAMPGSQVPSGNVFQNYWQAMRRFGIIRGRASRSEFWYFHLVWIIGTFILLIVDAVVFGPDFGASPLAGIFNIVHIIPSISVMVRRLHDRDNTGAWFLLAFTGIGYVPLLIFACLHGTVGPNRYGPDPLAAAPHVVQP